MKNPIVQATLAILERKIAAMPRADVEAMHRELASSEKASSEIGRGMLEILERRLRGTES